MDSHPRIGLRQDLKLYAGALSAGSDSSCERTLIADFYFVQETTLLSLTSTTRCISRRPPSLCRKARRCPRRPPMVSRCHRSLTTMCDDAPLALRAALSSTDEVTIDCTNFRASNVTNAAEQLL